MDGGFPHSSILAGLDGIPADSRRRGVLEVGSCDGFFTRELARRRAIVTAVDYEAKEQTGFALTERLSKIKSDFRQMNIYDTASRKLVNLTWCFA